MTTSTTTATTERITEYASSAGQSLRVDRERGIISGVKILGLCSKNDQGERYYDPAAVAKALPLYEQAKVNVDHVKDGQSASYANRIGRLVNVRASSDGLFADFHFNVKHQLAEQLIWDAEHAPENVGFSHDILGRKVRRNGKLIVEEISRVTSVDLVTNPATTKGLFESVTTPHTPALPSREREQPGQPGFDSLASLVGDIPAGVPDSLTHFVDAAERDEAEPVRDSLSAMLQC